jgi:hypothetical protein
MATPDDKVRSGYSLPSAGVPSSAPTYDYTSLMGNRAILKRSGENIQFDALMPRSGTITRQISLEDWGNDWLVLEFDEPFEYEGSRTSYCLVRARLLSHPIGSEFRPVFVLADPHHRLTQKEQWSSSDFDFVSRGEVDVERANDANASNQALQPTAGRSDI